MCLKVFRKWLGLGGFVISTNTENVYKFLNRIPQYNSSNVEITQNALRTELPRNDSLPGMVNKMVNETMQNSRSNHTEAGYGLNKDEIRQNLDFYRFPFL